MVRRNGWQEPLGNSDWKTPCGTAGARKKVPDTFFPNEVGFEYKRAKFPNEVGFEYKRAKTIPLPFYAVTPRIGYNKDQLFYPGEVIVQPSTSYPGGHFVALS